MAGDRADYGGKATVPRNPIRRHRSVRRVQRRADCEARRHGYAASAHLGFARARLPRARSVEAARRPQGSHLRHHRRVQWRAGAVSWPANHCRSGRRRGGKLWRRRTLGRLRSLARVAVASRLTTQAQICRKPSGENGRTPASAKHPLRNISKWNQPIGLSRHCHTGDLTSRLLHAETRGLAGRRQTWEPRVRGQHNNTKARRPQVRACGRL